MKLSVPRLRSPSFPFISLDKALVRTEMLFQQLRGQAVTRDDIMALLGYGRQSSGGLQTVAALKMYGLLTEEGSGESKRLKISLETEHYFVDQRASTRLPFCYHAAYLPHIMAELWQRWGVTPPSDMICRSQLRSEFGCTEKAAHDWIAIYKENLKHRLNDDLQHAKESTEIKMNSAKIPVQTSVHVVSPPISQPVTHSVNNPINHPKDKKDNIQDNKEYLSPDIECFRAYLPGQLCVRILASRPLHGQEYLSLIRLLNVQSDLLQDKG